ncbi:MAG TPA: hypothetical protein VHD36_10000 [Pirellulales bacterium]|nr:hypothetical protein [Pirellulales bacterium]
MRILLEDWIKTTGKTKLGDDDARKILSWIASGKCDDAAFLAKHKKEFAMIFKWRAGFNESVVVAKAALAENPKLTAAELKSIAQVFVNGGSTGQMTRRAAHVVQAIVKNGKAGLKAIAKKVLPGLMALSAATAAKRGWAGEGHTGSGAWGTLNEVARDAAAAELVEKMAFPMVLHTVDGIVNLVVSGLNDPTRYRILWRNGVRIDMRTGQPVE